MPTSGSFRPSDERTESYQWLPEFLQQVEKVRQAGWGRVEITFANHQPEFISHEIKDRVPTSPRSR